MIPIPSPKPIPMSAKAWASALERRCRRSKLSEPRSSMIAISCGWWIAAVAIPVAGEAPQRRKVEPTRSALSRRIGARIPASCRTFASKSRSPAEARKSATFVLESVIE
jgi:hypothetical protein